jgi:hypothetical protein
MAHFTGQIQAHEAPTLCPRVGIEKNLHRGIKADQGYMHHVVARTCQRPPPNRIDFVTFDLDSPLLYYLVSGSGNHANATTSIQRYS